MRHLSIFFFIYLTAFFLSCTVKAQGILTVQPKSGSVFICSASGTTIVSGTVTAVPTGTQTVTGTVTCSPSGTQTVSVSNIPTVVTSAANSSVLVQGSPATVFHGSQTFDANYKRIAVNSAGICNNGGSARRIRLYFSLPASPTCYFGGSGVTTATGIPLPVSTSQSFELDGADYFMVCGSSVSIKILEACY